jgi:hypothetical protein
MVKILKILQTLLQIFKVLVDAANEYNAEETSLAQHHKMFGDDGMELQEMYAH